MPAVSPVSAETMVLPQRRFSVVGGILSYLVPGLGQIAQGRVSKGVFFLVALLGLFFTGQALGDWRNVYLPAVARGGPVPPLTNILQHRWQFAGQFWIGIPAWPALWQYMDLPVPSEQTSPFWHHFQRGPRNFDDEPKDWEYIRIRDKTVDVAWVYTVVAGVLNILVIYDAFAGPAYAAASALPRNTGLPGTEEAPP